jgi:DNA-binding transcriptional LysR family regulator
MFADRLQHLRKIRVPVEVPGFDVILAWHTRTQNDPAHRWLREEIVRTSTLTTQQLPA